MALIVEDGTGLPTAESFASVAEADTYNTLRGNALWTGVAGVKEAALRKASDYMEQAYRLRWASYRVTATQRLSWPRAWVKLVDAPQGYGSWAAYVPNNIVPTEVKSACIELALLALAGDLNPPLERATLREKVADIEVAYDPNSVESKRYRNIDMLLAPYLTGSSMCVGLVRS